MEMDTDPLEGSSYDLGVTVKAEIKEEDEDDHYNTIRRVSRVSGKQLEILCEFLISNRSMVNAHNRSLQDKEFSRGKWKEIAETLNSQGYGARRDWAGWNKYWIDYKAKLKKRVAVFRASRVQTGGGPPTEKPFTAIEENFLLILGEELPPEIGAGTADVDVQESHAPESIIQNVSVLYPKILYPTQDIPLEPITEPLPQPMMSLSPLEPILEPLPHPMISLSPLTPMIQDQSVPSPPRNPTPRRATSAARSPRHRRRRREPPMSQEAARRALVHSTQMHAEAALRIAKAMERMVQTTEGIGNTASRIERILNAAFPTAAERVNRE